MSRSSDEINRCSRPKQRKESEDKHQNAVVFFKPKNAKSIPPQGRRGALLKRLKSLNRPSRVLSSNHPERNRSSTRRSPRIRI